MALHCRSHAKAADNQSDQTHKGKEAGGPIKRASQLRVRFRIVGDTGAPSENFVERLPREIEILRGRQFQKNAFGNAAAGHDNSGCGQALTTE